MADRIAVDPIVLLYAVRYALCRRSYVVGVLRDEVVTCWQVLDQFDRQVIERDVRGEIERAERVGDFDPIDLGVWRALLTWIEAQP